MKAPERIETARLLLRRPQPNDAEAIFARYASDPVVTRYLAWPTHRTIEDTRGFLGFCESEWSNWPAGPYLIELRDSGQLIGSTGLSFERTDLAATGYVLARDAWGKGHASEALSEMVNVGESVGIARLYALCHLQHAASARVLEKCGFIRECILRAHAQFPNLGEDGPGDVVCYGRTLPAEEEQV